MVYPESWAQAAVALVIGVLKAAEFNFMEDNFLPPSIGVSSLPPPSLTSEQEELCRKLDELYAKYPLKMRPSDMFRGAIFAATAERQNNPDWVAQAANSLREILYPFWSPHVNSVPDRKTEVFKKYGSVFVDSKFIAEVGKLYGLLNDLAHHGNTSAKVDCASFTISDFEGVLADFEKIMGEALSRQLDVHQEIDKILALGPTSTTPQTPQAHD